MHVFAIVPAAGRSQRMGAAKQLLDFRGRPMLLSVLEPLLESSITRLVLVTRHRIAAALGLETTHGEALQRRQPVASPAVQGAARSGRLTVAYNEDERTEMIESVRIGLRALRQSGTIGPGDGLLVCPGDQPEITSRDFEACVSAFFEDPERIVIATHAGRRGHPIVFPSSLQLFVESSACDRGLNALPRAHPGRVRLLECASRGVVQDIDTPDDYQEPPHSHVP